MWESQYNFEPTSSSINLIDSRPNTDVLDTSGIAVFGFSAYIWGDSRFKPDRLQILKNRLESKAGLLLTNKDVIVARLRSIDWDPTPLNIEVLMGYEFAQGRPFGITNRYQYRYWVISEVILDVNGACFGGRGVVGFNGGEYPKHHRDALIKAIDQVLASLKNQKTFPERVSRELDVMGRPLTSCRRAII